MTSPDVEHERSTERRERRLREEVARYRQAAEDALQQLDWCIGYLHGTGKRDLSRAMSRNRAYIRTNLLRRSEEPDPSSQD